MKSIDPVRPDPSSNDEFQRRLAGYTTSALAITGALAATAAPAAAQQYIETVLSTPLEITPGVGTANTMVIDFANMTAAPGGSANAPGKFAINDYVSNDFDVRSATVYGKGGNGVVATSSRDLKNFVRNDEIGPGEPLQSFGLLFDINTEAPNVGNFYPFDGNQNGGFVGFNFTLASKPGSDFWGWAEVSVDPAFDVTLYSFGYNADTDGFGHGLAVPAGAGTAPEPSALALLLLGGAAGMAAYRARVGRRRRRAEALPI
jgi:hypothetical protein